MGLIKTNSNYVIRKKHQTLDNGTVFERDFTTIGGVGDSFNSKEYTYKQGNFVFKINNEIPLPKIYQSNSWEKNGDSVVWDLETIPNSFDSLDDSTKISLKQDKYKLKDFAYYGSCVELIRTSVNDIIEKFPGELYSPISFGEGIAVFKNNGELLDEEYTYLVTNPFKLDIHTNPSTLTPNDLENIKYLQHHFNDYVMFDGERECSISQIEVYADGPIKSCPPYFVGKFDVITKDTYAKKTTFSIKCYCDENDNIVYVTNADGLGCYIRPKNNIYDNFYNKLDVFQQILLNKETTPKYTAIFEVMEEDKEDGYKLFYEKFTFPTSQDGYNLDIESVSFNEYIEKLYKYADFYDNIYCNNLYNQMTHESIKNFDLTRALISDDDTFEEHFENGEKLQKLLLTFGREFDEIKCYIDNIKNSNNITYDDSNNLPDYLLSDALKVDGWVLKNIFPKKKGLDAFSDDLETTYKPYDNIHTKVGNTINNKNGYFIGFTGEGCNQSTYYSDEFLWVDKEGFLRYKINQYIDNKEYTARDINNKFMKNLKLNSRHILRKKGTIDGIEMMLSLFGMHSKRWYDSLNRTSQKRILEGMNFSDLNLPYDYEIKEYVTVAEPLQEMNVYNDDNLPETKNLYDFVNATKNITYNTNEYINNKYVSYQGLPVYSHTNSSGDTYLYPFFSKDKPIDGKPYYQMNGGWINKGYNFTGIKFNNNNLGFIDTNPNIPIVDTLHGLLTVKPSNGLICYVNDISGFFLSVGGELYELMSEYEKLFFILTIENHSITIGNNVFSGIIRLFDDNGNEISVDLNVFNNGDRIKIYLNSEYKVLIGNENDIVVNYSIIYNGQIISLNGVDVPQEYLQNKPTNYFKLEDKDWNDVFGVLGWSTLPVNSSEYKAINNLKRNFEGNHPHGTCFGSDGGTEYLSYFYNLFKYALENNSFNINCYTNIVEYQSAINTVRDNAGFKNILNIYEDATLMNLYLDPKIHHFCDYKNTDGEIKYFYEHEKKNEDSYNFYESDYYSTIKGNLPVLSGNTSCLHQIMNLKNTEIIFYISDNETAIEQMYFIDTVVLHYLEQVLPANAIVHIRFQLREDNTSLST